MSEAAAVPHPAATVILLREGATGCEVLLVRRNARLDFHGGAWVFPGGRIDPGDYAAVADPTDAVNVAKQAAVREAREEAGVVIASEDLVTFSRWVTPTGLPKRFDAWFFATRAGGGTVEVDGREIDEHRWMPPQDALAAQRSGAIDLPPPTFVTLCQLAAHHSVADVLAAAAADPLGSFVPRVHVIRGGVCSLYAGDVAYESGEIDQPGSRHRLWMLDSGWRYERTQPTLARADERRARCG